MPRTLQQANISIVLITNTISKMTSIALIHSLHFVRKSGMQAGMTWSTKSPTLPQIAESFINNNEFKAIYGANLTDDTFVTLIYQHILDRTPDQSSYDLDEKPAFWWQKMLPASSIRNIPPDQLCLSLSWLSSHMLKYIVQWISIFCYPRSKKNR